MRVKLIRNWKKCWRMLSVQLSALLALLAALHEHLPFLQQYLPKDWMAIGALLIVVARVIHQPKLEDGDAKK